MNRSYYDMPADGTPITSPARSPLPSASGPLIPTSPDPFLPEPTRPTQPYFPANNNIRPRSMPPFNIPRRRGRQSRSSSRSSSSPTGLPDRARDAIKDTFTQSRSGLGVGILGALVGGVVAHEVSHATSRVRNKKTTHSRSRGLEPGGEKASRFATLAGAVVGGLGANAMEKRYEESRRREKLSRDDWVRRWGEDGGFWQSGWGYHPDSTRGRLRRRGTEEYEVVYEERKPRRRSEDPYRH